MFEEAPMNFPTNYKDDLVRSTPNLLDSQYAVHAHHVSRKILLGINSTTIPSGFFSPSDLLGEGAKPPTAIPAIGIFAAAIAPDVKPIFVIDGTEFPCILFEHQPLQLRMSLLLSDKLKVLHSVSA